MQPRWKRNEHVAEFHNPVNRSGRLAGLRLDCLKLGRLSLGAGLIECEHQSQSERQTLQNPAYPLQSSIIPTIGAVAP
jgi:hypothetical protein